MGSKIDLTGRRFGRLTVIKELPPKMCKGNRKRLYCLCVCSCGKEAVVPKENLMSGKTQSCGCYMKERASVCNTKHGDSKRAAVSRLYRIWSDMRKRCYQPLNKGYQNYGGRGITVCDEWRNSYEAFRDWAIPAGYGDDLTLDRIDVNGNYCPENCRWVTKTVQANNTRSNHYLEHNGETHTLAEWSRLCGISVHTLGYRIRSGWSFEDATTIPAARGNNANNITRLPAKNNGRNPR